MKIDKLSLGLSGGIIWGVSLLLLTLISVATGYAGGFLALVSDIYPGYAVTVSGSVIGMFYGFIDAFIALYVFGWLYNLLEAKLAKQAEKGGVT